MNLTEHQAKIVHWHNRRYPAVPDVKHEITRLALKLAEETGEVADAIIKVKGRAHTMHECSDVLNVVTVLLHKLGFSLTEALEYAATVDIRKPEIIP